MSTPVSTPIALDNKSANGYAHFVHIRNQELIDGGIDDPAIRKIVYLTEWKVLTADQRKEWKDKAFLAMDRKPSPIKAMDSKPNPIKAKKRNGHQHFVSLRNKELELNGMTDPVARRKAYLAEWKALTQAQKDKWTAKAKKAFPAVEAVPVA